MLLFSRIHISEKFQISRVLIRRDPKKGSGNWGIRKTKFENQGLIKRFSQGKTQDPMK